MNISKNIISFFQNWLFLFEQFLEKQQTNQIKIKSKIYQFLKNKSLQKSQTISFNDSMNFSNNFESSLINPKAFKEESFYNKVYDLMDDTNEIFNLLLEQNLLKKKDIDHLSLSEEKLPEYFGRILEMTLIYKQVLILIDMLSDYPDVLKHCSIQILPFFLINPLEKIYLHFGYECFSNK